MADMALPATFQADGIWQLQLADGSVQKIKFGQTGDQAFIGDWNGDGFSDLGIFRPETLTWYFDQDLNGMADAEFQIATMQPGDIPFIGDWDGNGQSTPGYYHPEDGSWHFSQIGDSEHEQVIDLDTSTGIPIVGDWNGDHKDTIGLYYPENGIVTLWNSPTEQIAFSVIPQGVPVVADWAGRGVDSLAVVVNDQWHPQFTNCNCIPGNPGAPFEFTVSDNSIPLAGKWSIKIGDSTSQSFK